MTFACLYDDCPQCGGDGHTGTDDDGHLYACYYCGTTGRILSSEAAAYWQALTDDAERFAPVRLGIFLRPMAHEYDWDDEATAPAAGHRMFTRFMLAPRVPAVSPFACAGDDLPW